ncbi:MAG: AAA family ATPase [Planctomycetota bacterium]|nr:AAA family ATPase [Planctomycetota bacterium]
MSNVLRLAIVDPDDTTREEIKAMLLGMDMIWLEAECSRYEFFSDVVAQTTPDIGLVVIDSHTDKALELIGKVTESSPECAILVVSGSKDGNLILQAIRAGAKEFLTQPLHVEELLAALGRISERRFGRSDTGKPRGSQVIAVAGSTGGVGTTSLAVNLACAMAKEEINSVALVDLDLCLGDADVQLDTIPEYTLVDVAQNVSRLDFSLLKRSLTKHSSGVYLLPRPVQWEDISLITPENVQRVLGLMKASFSHLIVDLSKSYSPVDMAALELASDILMVTQLDLPCLRNMVRLVASFKEMEGAIDKVKVIVNRAGLENGQITLKKAQETIGKEIFWQLPNDYRTMIEVRNNGVPLVEQAPKAAITHSIATLANVLMGRESVESATASRSKKLGRLLSFLPAKGEK